MISGNRRIPLVYSNQKAKEQITYRYSPVIKGILRVNCCPPVPIPPPVNTDPVFLSVTATGDPGSGNWAPEFISFPTNISLLISIYNVYSQDVSPFLNALKTANTITITKVGNPSINATFNNIIGAVNLTTYWKYSVSASVLNGNIVPGDTVIFSYT